MVTVRFFAAARAATGVSTAFGTPGTLDDVLREFDSPVLAKCSFLVNGIAVTDRTQPVRDGDLVDVLPPFAGG